MAYIGYGLGERVLEFKSRPDPDLVCHNFRLTEFQAPIARDQLAEFERRISMYSKNMSRLAQLLEPVPGLRIQSPGRRADPQSCYKWAVIFDQEPLADIPIDVILKAIRAEGLPMELSYGWVPSQLLFNLPESDYLLPANCPVAENIASKRTLMLAHQWLGMDEDTIVLISNVLAKLARNYHALKADAA
jgi:dTDP-4-amino-4,6-dideoxygalactose transaminase